MIIGKYGNQKFQEQFRKIQHDKEHQIHQHLFLYYIQKILKEPQNRVILVVKRDIQNYYDHIMNALMKFKSHNISIYEVIDDKHISNYVSYLCYSMLAS